MYDFLIVGAGLFGAVFAYEAGLAGKRCLVIDRREHIGGNVYCEDIEGITVHKYGPHIFHTDNKTLWDYINRFATFNRYTYSPMANYQGELYNFPFNMNTFYKLWGVKEPEVARHMIEKQRAISGISQPKNLEEQAIYMVGFDIYEKLIKGFAEKKWGRNCSELPPHFIEKIPIKFIFDNSYYDDTYQGIPIGGYNQIFEKSLEKADVKLGIDFFSDKDRYKYIADKIIFTGKIDEYFEYCYGALDYNSLTYETQTLNISNFQGNAIVNFTSPDVPYTRIIEHKHLEFDKGANTVISYEYPHSQGSGDEPYFPVNDDRNTALYQKYKQLADKEKNIVFGGRLGTFRDLDMSQAIMESLICAQLLIG